MGLIIIILIIVGVATSSIKFFLYLSKKWDLILNYLITLIATFIGVYAALYFTNKQEENTREEKVVSLVGSTIDAINVYNDMSNTILNAYKPDTSHELSKLLKINRETLNFQIITELLNSEFVLTNFYPGTLVQIRVRHGNFQQALKSLDMAIEKGSDNNYIAAVLKDIIMWNFKIGQQLMLEKQYHLDQISSQDIEDSIELNYKKEYEQAQQSVKEYKERQNK